MVDYAFYICRKCNRPFSWLPNVYNLDGSFVVGLCSDCLKGEINE